MAFQMMMKSCLIPNATPCLSENRGVRVLLFQPTKTTTSASIEKGWNGKYFSEDCPEGVYLWVVEFQTNTGNHKSVSGSVNLLR